MYSQPCAPIANMFHLLGWQYYRVWRCELDAYMEERNKRNVYKFIKPDLNFNKKRFDVQRKKVNKKTTKGKNSKNG